jgi:ubiquilin
MMQMAMSQVGQMGGLGGMGLGGLGGMGDMGGMGGFGGLGGLGGMGGSVSPQPTGDPKEIYKSQLEQLAAMGFPNESVNIDILKQTGGNVEAAVERLLSILK